MKKAKGLLALVLVFALSACVPAIGKTGPTASESASSTEFLPHSVLSQMELKNEQKQWVLSVPEQEFKGDVLSLVLTYTPSEQKQNKDKDKDKKKKKKERKKNRKNSTKQILLDSITLPIVKKNQEKDKTSTYPCNIIKKKGNIYYAFVLDTIDDMKIKEAKIYLRPVEELQEDKQELQLDLNGEMPFEPEDLLHPVKVWIIVVAIAIAAVIIILSIVLLLRRKKSVSGEICYELRIYHEDTNEKNICVFRLTDESDIDLWNTSDANGVELQSKIKKASSGLPELSAKLDMYARAVTIRYKQNDKTICAVLNDDYRLAVINGPEGKELLRIYFIISE